MRAVWTAGLLAALLAGGCELAEVATPEGEDLLVVEAVLSAGTGQQQLLLHRSLNGRVVRGEPDARVTVTSSLGDTIQLLELSTHDACTDGLFAGQVDSLTVEASCYWTPVLEVMPGAEYELRVETRDGLVARGKTRVPGFFSVLRPRLAASEHRVCAVEPGTNLGTAWSVSDGAWSYLISAEILGLGEALRRLGLDVDAPNRLELTGLAVSERDTTLVVPAQLGVFERFDLDPELMALLQNGLPPDVLVQMIVAAADRNLINAVRGGSFNPSGSVRISSVVGDGVGVFGSVVPLGFSLVATDDPGMPRCE